MMTNIEETTRRSKTTRVAAATVSAGLLLALATGGLWSDSGDVGTGQGAEPAAQTEQPMGNDSPKDYSGEPVVRAHPRGLPRRRSRDRRDPRQPQSRVPAGTTTRREYGDATAD